MINNLASIIFKILLFLDKILNLLFKRSFIIHLSDFIEKQVKKDDMIFHVSNSLIQWRVNSFYEKEPETIDWINSFEKDSVFWDIGSNIGLYSIYAAKRKNAKVFSFEPSTSNLRILSRNIFINKLSNQIYLIPLALNSKNSLNFSQIKESTFREGGAENSFSVDYNWQGKSFKPKNEYNTLGTSIDFLTKNKIIPLPNYIKIDVDGIEHLILRGGIETLKSKKIKSVLIEINDAFTEQHKTCIKIMETLGFKISSKLHAPIFDNSKYKDQFNYIFKRVN